jgi:thioredoxin 1
LRFLLSAHSGGKTIMAENANIIEISDATFEQEVLKSNVPVLVDFWAVWCAPCKMLAPAVEALAGEYAGKARVAKLNVDDSPNPPMRYGIRGIPTLILFKNGEEKDRLVGVTPKDTIAQMIDAHLN